MAFFAWNSKLETGINSIDQQHKTLVDLINRLHDAMKGGRGAEITGPILSELVQYTATHFSAEEALFAAHKYPGALAHKRVHDDLRKQVEQLKEQSASGRAFISIELMAFLKDWLQNHIQGQDLQYAPFLKQHGVS
jgi:hemerythrin-like metal-binding protein